jgi:hypothetical protein
MGKVKSKVFTRENLCFLVLLIFFGFVGWFFKSSITKILISKDMNYMWNIGFFVLIAVMCKFLRLELDQHISDSNIVAKPDLYQIFIHTGFPIIIIHIIFWFIFRLDPNLYRYISNTLFDLILIDIIFWGNLFKAILTNIRFWILKNLLKIFLDLKTFLKNQYFPTVYMDSGDPYNDLERAPRPNLPQRQLPGVLNFPYGPLPALPAPQAPQTLEPGHMEVQMQMPSILPWAPGRQAQVQAQIQAWMQVQTQAQAQEQEQAQAQAQAQEQEQAQAQAQEQAPV